MSSQITNQGDVGYIDGLLVFPSDLLNDNTSQLNADGEVLASLIGAYDAIPMINPVVLTATVGGGHVNVGVGGAGQWLIVQGRMCDYIPTTNFVQSPPDVALTRTDILCVQYTQQATDGVVRVYQKPDGSDDTTTIFTERQGVTWDYVQGTNGAGQPATPVGFELYAVIPVPASAVSLTPVKQFKTTQALGFSLNNLIGAVTLAGGTDISVGVSGNTITIALSVAIVDTVNGASGAITIVAGTGVNVGTSGGTITITNTQTATTVNSIAGAVSVVGGTGITVGTAGSTITITSTGVTDVNGVVGSVTLAGAGGISVGVSGSTITLTGTSGVSSLNSLVGGLSLTSTGGSIAIAPSGSTINLEVVPMGAIGGTSTPAAQAGIIMVSKWMNDGSYLPTTPIPITDDHFLVYPTLLGAGWFGLAGNVGNCTNEMHVHLKVTSGAGAQVIGGNFLTNSRATFLSLDGVQFYSSGLTTITQNWSVSVPDDGATHVLIIHVALNVFGDLELDLSTFLPQNASGGIDSTKFTIAGPGF